MKTLHLLISTTIASTALATLARPVTAADYPQGIRILDVQLLRPGGSPADFINVRSPSVHGHQALFMTAYLTYLNEPLEVGLSGGSTGAAISHQLGLELSASLSLWDRLAIGVAMPFSFLQRCTDGLCGDSATSGLSEQNFDGSGFGDLRLILRGAILRPSAARRFGLGAGVSVSVPTADATAFVGEGSLEVGDDPDSKEFLSPTVLAYLSAAYDFGRVRVGTNAGLLARREQEFRDLTVGSQLVYGAAAGVAVLPWLEALAELNGAISVTHASTANAPHEALLAARMVRGTFRVDVGGGVGLIGDYGAPDFRFFVGLGLTAPIAGADADADGIVDSDDGCPNEPEDRDGFADGDGCPDLDNDQDGIPDALDQCPDRPAMTASGCSLPDADGDGIPDDLDACPRKPEDTDGFADDDGCPDPDNDGDAIADASDKCPDKAETLNAHQDEDGCPDLAPPSVAPPRVGAPKKIDIPQRIAFAPGRALLLPSAKKTLDDLAALLRENPQMGTIRIEGHTDDSGSRRRNLRLSRLRAQVVRRYLISKGVAANRLQAVGYGSQRPISPPGTAEGRRKNRRVEFIILQGGPAR